MQNGSALDQAARAILDGSDPNWEGLESSDDQNTRTLTHQLRVLSAVGRVHRSELPSQYRSDQWGHLRLLEKVGAGAFGEVYRAWDTRLDREVALKLLPAGKALAVESEPIIHEGRLLARVRHPNVATIYGAEVIDGRIGLWMEFVHGRTLEQMLRSGHQFTVASVADLGIEICRAVAAVHSAGLVHRDIKTQNVMRADDGRVVLMDFGTGKDAADEAAKAAGTPLYLAPEILRGDVATAQSDVYSVGIVLYHLLTGSFPVQGRSIADLCQRHQHNDVKALGDVRPDLPPGLRAVVQRAIDPDLHGRYQSTEELAADLTPWQTRPPQVWRWVAAAVILAGLIGAVWISRNVGAASAVSAAGIFDNPAVVVLPFKNLTTEPANDFIADGLTYELIRTLTAVDGLNVKSATSSFALKGKSPDLAGLSRQLGVNLVLEGSVMQSGGRWRIQAQLARVAGDKPVWTNRYDRKADEILSVQDEIAVAVANQLRLTLGRGHRSYQIDAPSQAQYLEARTLVQRRGTPNATAAVALFNEIIVRNPSFAPAYAGLADAYAYMSQDLPDVGGLPPDRAVALMRPAAEKALELDALLAEAHAAMAIVYSREFRWDDADRSFKQALDINPGLTHVYTSYSLTTLLPLGRFAEAEALLDDARHRDPLDPAVLREIALVQLGSERPADAVATLDRALEMDPKLPYAPMLRARALALAGRFEESMAFWEPLKMETGFQHWLAYAFVKAGRRAEVEEIARQNTRPYRLAILYTALGRRDEALAALDLAATQDPHRTVRLLQYPEMVSLKGDPRFEAIRVRFNLH